MKPTALIIAQHPDLTWSLPALLARSGFETDLITTISFMQKAKHLRRCWVVSFEEQVAKAAEQVEKNSYDWVIIADDCMLADILKSSLSDELKLKLLPVNAIQDFSHLTSKIGLSHTLTKHKIKTPPFAVAENYTEAKAAAEALGFPVLMKIDFSGGGDGTFECQNLESIKKDIFEKPVLIQKKISGKEFDLSALFLEGELIHFSYSRFEKICFNKFGPSILRTYWPLNLINETVFKEISALGKALGAHGFVNISCIDADDGTGRYFFEADMRPNAWVEFPRFFGEDPAHRINAWFKHRSTLSYPVKNNSLHKKPVKMAYFFRLSFFELLINRYSVWKFISWDDPKLIRLLLTKKWFEKPNLYWQRLQNHSKRFIFLLKEKVMFPLARIFIPKKYRAPIRKIVARSLSAFL